MELNLLFCAFDSRNKHYILISDIFDDELMLELTKYIGEKHLQLGIALGIREVDIQNIMLDNKFIRDVHIKILIVSIK